jgi:myo-inositol 2-dehydrogenase / D-chiro-inositol 1-dehydrogenase
VRFGLIGYGAWGRHHAAAIAGTSGVSLAAIACASEATASAARADHPGVPVHLDYRALLKDSAIDAVDVVAPNHLHAEIGCAALNAGKDVLLEKPMATTVEDCDRLLATAAAHGRVLSIGHELRLSGQWGAIKRLIEAGEIGEPRYALVTLFRFPYRRGSGGWRYDAGKVGSWILEEPVHFFDFVMWYFERWGDPRSVLAVGNAQAAAAGMADNFSAIVRFPGTLYAVITQSLAGFEHHHTVEIVGSEGAIRTWWSGTMDRTEHPAFELKVRRRGRTECEVLEIGASGEVFELQEEIARTAAAFQARRPLVSGAEARKRIVVCLETERSLREGREVALAF